MGDLAPNLAFERKKIEVQISQLRHNVSAGELRVMQLEIDLAKAQENIAATEAAISEQEALLASLGQDEE